MIFGTISIIRRIIMLVPLPLRSVIGGELKKSLILLVLVLIRLLVSASFAVTFVNMARKEVFVCVDVDFPGEFLAACFVGLLVALVGVMFVVLPGCVEASGFEFYFDDVLPVGHAD